ncbi:hypothetical protein TRFO_19010 [Tritrichomonas foetus]|uniref:Uncharacterized protein n=1 Tax=Tritrichomonas foetus TaxID=1144522 RepID=A0A1J4KNV4_9EUKA|nr:hypothetical protein TRFO_19010 [Tritrichomonas foetus]|eukprot:OHT11476.1 hypothetical protein TRFO_19010 [Tritrichomonas foetus]
MKTGAKRTKKAPVNEEAPAELQSSPFLQMPADPLATYVGQYGLYYLGFAGGVISTPPDSLQSVNIEMWPLDQIYKLRSDLISLSLLIDEDDKVIQKDLKIGFEDVVTGLHENEDEETLRFQRLPLSNKIKTTKEIRFDPIVRPCSPMPSIQPAQLISHTRARVEQLSRARPQSAHLRRTQSSSNIKSLTQDTLWENVDLFLHPVEKITQIQQYMIPSKPKNNLEILNEPVGPHYSTTICRAPNVLSDPVKSRLIIPPPPADLTGNTDTSSYLHSRLVSAVVPLLGSKDKRATGKNSMSSGSRGVKSENEENTTLAASNTAILNDLKNTEYNSTPTAECTGFTGYGWLNFEERLAMELSYVGIEGSGNVVTSVDCPIAQDLAEAIKEHDAVIKEANKWKKIMADIVQKRRPILEDRNRKHKEWSAAMNQYYAQEKAKQAQEKKKSRPPHSTSTESD